MNSSYKGLFKPQTGATRRVEPKAWFSLIEELGYKGVVFDCDGTLVLSEEAHLKAFSLAVAEQGFDLEKDWYLERTGLDRITTCREMAIDFGAGFDVSAVVERSKTAFLEYVHLVSPIWATRLLVEQLKNYDYKIAVGTSCEAPLAKASLLQVGLLSYFQCIVSVSDGHEPKPSPAIFEHVASCLRLRPEEILVIEDSPQGVQAAKNAKMDVLEISSN